MDEQEWLAEIKTRRAQIGPGRWKLGNRGPTEQHRILQVDPVDSDRWLADIAEQRDAEFVAHAPGDIDWLIGQVENTDNRIENYLAKLDNQRAENARLNQQVENLKAEVRRRQGWVPPDQARQR
jgi:hypothetical protein